MMRAVIAAMTVALCAAPAARAQGSLRDAASVPAAVSAPGAWQYDAGDPAGDEPISPGRAVLYSLLVPGLGDYKLGNTGRAVVFFGVEAAIWVSYAVFEVQGQNREDEYQDLAVQFAGVTSTGHSDDYYATIRDYDNSDEYEAVVKEDGRYFEGLGTNQELEQYFIDNRMSDYEPWRWASLDARLQYSETRSSSKTSYRRADYMFAAAAANRLVSAVFAYASARGLQKGHEVGYDLRVAPAPGGVDVAFALTRSF